MVRFFLFIYSALLNVGYSAPGREKIIQFNDRDSASSMGDHRTEVQRDIKESFEVGREDNDEMPNIWYPNGILPGFKEACLDFYWVRRICDNYKYISSKSHSLLSLDLS